MLAAAAVLLLLFVELCSVVALSGGRLTGVQELQTALFWLLPLLVLGAAIFGVAGTLLGALLVRADQSSRVRQALSAVAALAAGLFGFAISGGRLLSAPAIRVTFVLGLALSAAAVVYTVSPPLARLVRRWPVRAAAGALLFLVLLELVNRFVLVRLYPGFHAALAILALLGASALPLGLEPGAGGSSPRVARAGLGIFAALLLGSALLLRPASERLGHFDNFRLLMLDNAPLLGQAVRVAAALAPEAAPAARDCGPSCDDPALPPSNSTLDLRGRDLLLVSIDALRADHVGAYGYARKTTPNIDELARTGVLFRHAYTPTPHTSYAVTSMMTGKYMRPLLLQGAAQDSETWSSLLRTYGYRTAAFYPPAVFFIDADRFTAFRDDFLGFEYRKVEFLEGKGRVQQLESYLDESPPDKPIFAWVHLFGPHEPYEAHPEHVFGDRDVDRYDSEIRAADATLGELVAAFRRRSPRAVVIVTADHGEEFGDHGGRYHGTTVYEEQVRVPLVVSVPGAPSSHVVEEPVQTIDLLPTVLSSLSIPRPPRVRGRDLSAALAAQPKAAEGFAFAETEEQALLAQGRLRLVCARKVGACRLYDVVADPAQQRDIAAAHADRFDKMRRTLHELAASHGRYEVRGLRAQGKGWPAAILRGVAGDADAAPEIAGLLDDADREIRRKAAELLFEAARPVTAPALRLALTRDEDAEVKQYAALALTRLGEGAPLAYELAKSGDPKWRRLSALALAETGDARGEAELIAWWSSEGSRDYERSRQLLRALGNIKSKKAVWSLTQSLGDVRLRPYIAETLAAIGDDAARGPLAVALAKERYQGAREAIVRALVDLGAEGELAPPLTRFLGVPDPVRNGVGLAARAGILQYVGGPNRRDLTKLREQSGIGAALLLTVPPGKSRKVRALVRAHTRGKNPGQVLLGLPRQALVTAKGKPTSRRPELDPERSLRLTIAGEGEPVEVYAEVPASMAVLPGHSLRLVVFADREVVVEALALVPIAEELPPPEPEPWQPARAESTAPTPAPSPPASSPAGAWPGKDSG